MPVFIGSSVVVIPFRCSLMAIPSATDFLVFISQLGGTINREVGTELFVVPGLGSKEVNGHSRLLV